MLHTTTPPYIIEQYIRQVGVRINGFKNKKHRLWNFDCVYGCDDNKSSSRGYFHYHENTFFYKCHKCGYANSFTFWLKDFAPDLYKEMYMDILEDMRGYDTSDIGDKNSGQCLTQTTKKQTDINIHTEDESDELEIDLTEGYKGDMFKNVQSIAELSESHGARQYVKMRQIPEHMFSKLYYTDSFCKWVNSWKPDTFTYQLQYDEPRLIIPFYNTKGRVFVVQGRSFKRKSDLRYITVKRNDDSPKIYGLERLDKNKPAMVLEGPIDSIFVDNALGMAGADASILEDYVDDYVKVYDNEPRSKHITRRINQDIELGRSVVIWPKYIQQKDVNDMILKGGYTRDQINDIIYSNIYRGLTAKLKFADWKIHKK